MTGSRDMRILVSWDQFENQDPDLPTLNLMALVKADTGASDAEVTAALRRDRQRCRAARGDQ
jgi:hypothetical protein